MENFLVEYLLPIFGSLVSFLAILLTRKVLMYLHIKLGIATDDKFARDLEGTIRDAIYAAEEKAATEFKTGLPKWTSDMKYKWAINMVGNRFPQLTREEADAKIAAMLGKTCGIGATKDIGESCEPKFDPIVEAELRKP